LTWFSQGYNSSNGFLDQEWRVYKSKTLTCIQKTLFYNSLTIFWELLRIPFYSSLFLFFLCQKNRRTNRLNSFVSPFSLSKRIQKTNRLRILLILPFPLNKIFQRTNRLRYLLFPLTKIQRTNHLRILCLNTLEGTPFVVQVEGTSTWVVVLRTRERTSLVD